MNFVDWSTGVLWKFLETYEASGILQTIGLNDLAVAEAWWGEGAITAPEWHESKRRTSLIDALSELSDAHILDENRQSPRYYHPSEFIRTVSSPSELNAVLAQYWEVFVKTELKPREERLLAVMEELSHVEDSETPEINRISIDQIEAALKDGMDRETIYLTAKTLDDLHLISWLPAGLYFTTYITYRGLARLLKRDFTVSSREIDALVREWETTSVEFKREIHTGTADEKAEFIKDLIALANTQASGRRWLIVGFEDKTRSWTQDPNPKLTQDHIEQLLSEYVEPMIQVRYEVVQYRTGKVGRLEVLRNPANLPHKVKRSFGDRRRLPAGRVFVRHGSQVEEPGQLELTQRDRQCPGLRD